MSLSEPGRLVIVVGASGAGKDSVIKAAQAHFKTHPRVEFVRRIITRECDPKAEVHDSVSEQQFMQQKALGEFSVWWNANGLFYGLPVAIHEKIENGQLLIANGSRGALADIRSRFKHLTIVHIVVSADVLAQRLERRSRENAQEIKQRLQRNKTLAPIDENDVITIDNSGERQAAIDDFIALIASM